MADLHIPDAAVDEVREIADEHDDTLRDQARAIAAPVVAAELRRLAETYQGEADRLDVADRRVPGLATAAGRLAQRADELDPPQPGGDH
ncbi:hypothetical protein ABT341_00375 [Pseudonocardia alni]|uniref:hypothetical protein n=1 Tax=Pseudonocardia alni TaxID=33907 RepID=UPI0033188246